MNSTNLIARMAVSPNPIAWYHRSIRRQMLSPMQPVDDPSVVIVRPYGVAKGIGVTTPPVDYTLSHYGGTLRGAKICLLYTSPSPRD